MISGGVLTSSRNKALNWLFEKRRVMVRAVIREAVLEYENGRHAKDLFVRPPCSREDFSPERSSS